MKNFSKNIILWIVIGLLLIALFNLFQNSSTTNNNSEISSYGDSLSLSTYGNYLAIGCEKYDSIITLGCIN